MDVSWEIRRRPWLGRLALKAIPNLHWQVNVRPIGNLAIRLRQHRMFWLRPPLIHEGFMLGALQRVLHKGDVAYDVGANIGLYSRFMLQVFGASHVYAFEPIAANCGLIERNMVLAGCSGRLTVIPHAVSDQDGPCDFQADQLTSNSGALSIVTKGEASASHAQYGLPPAISKLQSSRLDTLLETGLIAKPDVLKIDIEGAEGMALAGAARLLSLYHPRLVIELHGNEVSKAVLQLLWSLGYHCFGNVEINGTAAYKELEPSDLKHLTDLYSLHYLVASTRKEDLQESIADYQQQS